jgi:hypothetical protein
MCGDATRVRQFLFRAAENQNVLRPDPESSYMRTGTLAALAATILLVSPAERVGAQTVAQATVPLIVEGNRPFIELTFRKPDGSVRKARFLIDTGGGGFLITEPLAHDLGLNWGPKYRKRARSSPWSSVTDMFGSGVGRNAAFVQFFDDGVVAPSCWQSLTHQIYLGDAAFVAALQAQVCELSMLAEIPRVQRWPVHDPLGASNANSAVPAGRGNRTIRNAAIVAAFRTGRHTMREIGEHFGVHYSTVSRVVREFEVLNAARCKTSSLNCSPILYDRCLKPIGSFCNWGNSAASPIGVAYATGTVRSKQWKPTQTRR